MGWQLFRVEQTNKQTNKSFRDRPRLHYLQNPGDEDGVVLRTIGLFESNWNKRLSVGNIWLNLVAWNLKTQFTELLFCKRQCSPSSRNEGKFYVVYIQHLLQYCQRDCRFTYSRLWRFVRRRLVCDFRKSSLPRSSGRLKKNVPCCTTLGITWRGK
jgi:hypothetical protein